MTQLYIIQCFSGFELANTVSLSPTSSSEKSDLLKYKVTTQQFWVRSDSEISEYPQKSAILQSRKFTSWSQIQCLSQNQRKN